MSNAKAGEKNPMYGRTGENHSWFGLSHSEATKAKMSSAKIGDKNPIFGKSRAVGAGSPSQKMEVIDIQNNITTIYDSMSSAASALNIRKSTISGYFSHNRKLYKNRYIFIKCKSSCRRYSSLSQSLAIMKHTKCNHKYVEKQNAYLSSWLLIWEIFLKQWAKDIILDSLSGTGDPLNLAIGIRKLTLRTLINVGEAPLGPRVGFPYWPLSGSRRKTNKKKYISSIKNVFFLYSWVSPPPRRRRRTHTRFFHIFCQLRGRNLKGGRSDRSTFDNTKGRVTGNSLQ